MQRCGAQANEKLNTEWPKKIIKSPAPLPGQKKGS
jgi:hypothetical protein